MVEARVEEDPDRCELRVWNPGSISPDLAVQIFKRSFSTKAGIGLSLGTFRLFGPAGLSSLPPLTFTEKPISRGPSKVRARRALNRPRPFAGLCRVEFHERSGNTRGQIAQSRSRAYGLKPDLIARIEFAHDASCLAVKL